MIQTFSHHEPDVRSALYISDAVIIGKQVTIGHGAILHGCTVGDSTLIGMGAIVLDGAVIGEHCLIAAGTLVPENKIIPPGHLIMGLPSRIIRPLTIEEKAHIVRSAEEYRELARQHALSRNV